MEEMKESISQLQQLFMKQMDDFQSQLQKTAAPSTTSTLAADFATFKSFVLTALQSLQNQLQFVVRTQDNMEMQSRKKILLFHGLPEAKTEDVNALVVKMVVDKLKVTDFSTNCISRCHRMGRAANLNKPRPILVKIRDLSLRNKIWSAKANLKGSGATLSEFLTKIRHDVFMTARQRFGVTKCWTREGVVYVLGPDETRHRVTSLSDLNQLGEPSKSPKLAAVAPKDVAPKSRRVAAGTRK